MIEHVSVYLTEARQDGTDARQTAAEQVLTTQALSVSQGHTHTSLQSKS